MIDEIEQLSYRLPKLNLPKQVISGYRKPPASPAECLFARTTLNLTANLKTKVMPCQFGGTPDCSQCGCIASAGLSAVGDYKLFGALPLRKIFIASDNIGKGVRKIIV
ncbi:MAG: hypothetical protein ACR2N3_09125 [Pyrinomonadaceae bacterium]